MKFKVGFTIDGETLFKMLAGFLPVENVTVEELGATPPPAQKRLTRQIKPKNKNRKPAFAVDLTKGSNKLIMELLGDGRAHRAVELRPSFEAAGFSNNSITSRLIALQKHGTVAHLDDGTWKLTVEAFLSQAKVHA